MKLIINIKPFSFKLTRKLITSQGIIHKKIGLLLQIKDSDGNYGWGEVSPIEENELKKCIESLDIIGSKTTKDSIESYLFELPGALAFGLGSSLADLDNINESKIDFEQLNIMQSSYLLPTDVDPLKSISKYVFVK